MEMLNKNKAKKNWHVAHAQTQRRPRDGSSDLLASRQFKGLNRRHLGEQLTESEDKGGIYTEGF